MSELIGLLCGLLLLAVTLVTGHLAARAHEDNMRRRLPAVAHMRCTDLAAMPDAVAGPSPPQLITSEVCLGLDHFRGVLGQLKSLVGGEVRSYQRVLDRARREVTLRLLEQAQQQGFNALANLRIDFVDVSGTALTRRKASMVSVLATATAYHAANP